MDRNFNLIDVYNAVKQQKKFVILFCTISVLLAFILVTFMPKQYSATAIIVPANPYLADKNRISNQHIQLLYTFFGTDEDQDILIGFLKLPELYTHLSKKFDLIKYYNPKAETNEERLFKSSLNLKEDLGILKNENNQVIINLWLKDATLAANICNEAANYTNEFIKLQWKQQSEVELKAIQKQVSQLQQQRDFLSNKGADSILQYYPTIQSIDEQVRTLFAEQTKISLSLQTMPNALFIVQYASKSNVAERPNKLLIITTTLLASFFFSILVASFFFKKN